MTEHSKTHTVTGQQFKARQSPTSKTNDIFKRRVSRREAISTVAAAGILAGLAVVGVGSYYAGLATTSARTETRTQTLVQTVSPTSTQVQNIGRASVPVTIPVMAGFYKGQGVLFIATESSDSSLAQSLTTKTGFRVVSAPAMAQTPTDSSADVFLFTNGTQGNGLLGFQSEVLDAIPGDQGYSPARRVNRVTWKSAASSTELRSADEINDAQRKGDITIEITKIILNIPLISWPGGRMKLADSSELNDQTAYGGTQLMSLDTTGKTATFKVHRCFAQDGSQEYYIATDASLAGPAGDLGVTPAPKMQAVLKSPAASDFFVFVNGVPGPGPMGFQSSIGASKPGDQTYTPYWRINAVSWKDPTQAVILTSRADLAAYAASLDISPMMGGLNVNCPFVVVK